VIPINNNATTDKAPSKKVLLAAPRGYCAGVDRAVIAVEKALDHYGAPVYVRKQIVHNKHVVESLERRGAIFVDEVDEAPEGCIMIFSATKKLRAPQAKRQIWFSSLMAMLTSLTPRSKTQTK